jgi:hypothetical protein
MYKGSACTRSKTESVCPFEDTREQETPGEGTTGLPLFGVLLLAYAAHAAGAPITNRTCTAGRFIRVRHFIGGPPSVIPAAGRCLLFLIGFRE